MTDLPTAQIKAMLMNASCVLAAAEFGASPVNVDPTFKDAAEQSKNVALYEGAKIFYAVLLQAFQDQTGIWPDPVLPKPVVTPIPAPAKPVGPASPPATSAPSGPVSSNPIPLGTAVGQVSQIASTVAGVAQAVSGALAGAAAG